MSCPASAGREQDSVAPLATRKVKAKRAGAYCTMLSRRVDRASALVARHS